MQKHRIPRNYLVYGKVGRGSIKVSPREVLFEIHGTVIEAAVTRLDIAEELPR